MFFRKKLAISSPSTAEINHIFDRLIKNQLTEQELKLALKCKQALFDKICLSHVKNNLIRDAFEQPSSNIYNLVHEQRGLLPTSNTRGVRKKFYDEYIHLIDPLRLATTHDGFNQHSRENFSSQCLVIRVGDHVFLRKVMDVYERLAKRYTSNQNKRGILQIFPSSDPSLIPESIRAKKHFTFDTDSSRSFMTDENDRPKFFSKANLFCKDDQSIEAITQPIKENTRLKIYIAGHSNPGEEALQSLEIASRTFMIDYISIANALDDIFSRLFPNGKAKNVEISMIACYTGIGNHRSSAFAVKLLRELHDRGHDVFIKASIGPRSAPVPFINKTPYPKRLFVMDEDNTSVFSCEVQGSWVYEVLKSLRNYKDKYFVNEKISQALDEIITLIKSNQPYVNDVSRVLLLNKLKNVKELIPHHGKVMNFFFTKVLRSSLEHKLDGLIHSYDEKRVEANIARVKKIL